MELIFSSPAYQDGAWRVDCVVMEAVSNTISKVTASYVVTLPELPEGADTADVLAAARAEAEAV